MLVAVIGPGGDFAFEDNVAFGDAGRLIALAPEIIANKGEPNTGYRGVQLRPTKRNYVAFNESKLYDGSELQPCVSQSLSALDTSVYREGVKSKEIDATLWTAIFDENFAYQDAISEATMARARELGVKLFIEDDTRYDDGGVPVKIWLT